MTVVLGYVRIEKRKKLKEYYDTNDLDRSKTDQ